VSLPPLAGLRWLLLAAAALWPPAAPAQHGAGDVVYVPTPQTVVDLMLQMANVGPGDSVIDLGSGDGRVVISAAKRGAQALGVDLDRQLLAIAIESARREGVASRAAFREQNLFETDLRQATVITTYLLPDMNLKLRPKLLELKPGTRVVAHDYHMGDWHPDWRETLAVPGKAVGNPGVSYVYLWYVPAKVAGRWRTEIPVGSATALLEFELEQRYQVLKGRAYAVGGRPTRLQTPSLRGDALTFHLELGPGRPPIRYEFRGRVSGDELTGTLFVWERNVRRERAFEARRISQDAAAAVN
jgi:SAM-dependent methyltransferase